MRFCNQNPSPALARAPALAAALVLSVWEPNIHMLAQKFGAKTRVPTLPSLHVSPFVRVGGRDYVRQHHSLTC